MSIYCYMRHVVHLYTVIVFAYNMPYRITEETSDCKLQPLTKLGKNIFMINRVYNTREPLTETNF